MGPIFVREWLTVPRRPGHYLLRATYLGALWVLGITLWQTSVGWNHTPTVGDTARFGTLFFHVVTRWVQVPVVVFFAALSAAAAVTTEKDRRTFLLLLLTDLRNREIVLGKLFGSLLQIGFLLTSLLPFLALLLLLGGVSLPQAGQALLVMGSAAVAAGSLGGLIALWRDKTFPTLALTVLSLVLYFLVVRGLVLLSYFFSALSPTTVEDWQRWLDPLLAMEGVLDPGDEAGTLPPAVGFALTMVGWTVLLNGWAVLRLRVWNPSGEPIMQREGMDKEQEEKDRARAHAAPGAVRAVWANPILWREICTRAYGRRLLLVKVAYFVVFALVCYGALAPWWQTGTRGDYAAAWGLVPLGILSLLLVSTQAVTSITGERDIGALDLLLVTDLTPKEFIYGKIGGILWNVLVYVLPPLLLAAVYGWIGFLATPPKNHPELLGPRNFEAALCVAGAASVVFAFAVVLGIHIALRNVNSRLAILQTLGTAFFLSGGTLLAIALILINGRFEYQWTSFVLFIMAGVGGLWWVLNGGRPAAALTVASWLCPIAVFYTVTNILVARPGSQESGDPLIPFVVVAGAFGFAVTAMLVPLISEFDVALGRTTAGGE